VVAPLGVFPVVVPQEVLQAAVVEGAVTGVAEAVDKSWLIKSTLKRIR
jgi:hypothetical protein